MRRRDIKGSVRWPNDGFDDRLGLVSISSKVLGSRKMVSIYDINVTIRTSVDPIPKVAAAHSIAEKRNAIINTTICSVFKLKKIQDICCC
jgi:hypothetical protein